MKLDFWNNPIVVSAFRLKYRRGAPTVMTCLWLVALLGLGAILHRYRARLPVPWARAYLVAVIGLQFVVSAIYAWSTTYSSLRAEVTQRTLDFQRIAALSPRQILLGKLLGEPAGSYLLAIATVPLAVVCYALGAASLPVVFWLYVNLITTGLMCGSLGLLQPLEVNPSKPASSGNTSGTAVGLGIMFLMFMPAVIANAGNLAGNPVGGLLVGCFTPILSIYGVATGQPWEPQLTLWGAGLPFLLIAPVAQLALAAVCFETTARTMLNPLNPPMSKPQAYAVLAVVDVVAAGLLLDQGLWPNPLADTVAAFCLAHLVVSLFLATRVTPWREALLSWVWRFRGRRSWLRDSLVGDRSENTAALAVFCLIGAVGLVLLVWLPATLLGQPGAAPLVAVRQAAPVLVATPLLILSLGLLYQWCVLVAGRYGWMAFALLVGLAVLLPVLAGEYYDQILPRMTGQQYHGEAELARSLSPASHYARWLDTAAAPLPVYPLLVSYGLLLLIAWAAVRGRIHRHIEVVDRKLAAMGVSSPSIKVVSPPASSSGPAGE
jgi:hypothetical protein